MKSLLIFTLALTGLCHTAIAQKKLADIPYVKNGHERQVLDIYTSAKPTGNSLPVMFWIHGGGWVVGDKSDVALKPKVLMERGFVFVSTNYRLLPKVKMETLIGDAAKSLGWVHRNIAKHGGDPSQIFVGGHSAGAQLAVVWEGHLTKDPETVGTSELSHGPPAYLLVALAPVLALA